MNIVLRGLSWCYRFVTWARNECYDRQWLPIYKSSIPVISVGNVTAGGNGKTPLVLTIVQELIKRGRAPVVLSRGYRGSLRGPHLVTSTDTYEEVGDEPLLMAAEVPVVVAKDRVAGAKFIESLARFDTIVLDDGFQHRRLARSVDIVSIDVGSTGATDKFVQGALLPEGRFREDRDKALSRATMIVLSERGFASGRDVPEDFKKVLPHGVPIFRSSIVPGGVVNEEGKALSPPATVVAFCGIANPEPFYKTLRTYGFTLARTVSFPDHFAFTHEQINALRGAEHEGMPLVCTVKDAVKLRGRAHPEIYLFTMTTEIMPTDTFFDALFTQLGVAPSSH